MACCAIAFFVVSQLLWPVRWLRAQFGVSRSDVVAWSLEGASNPAPARAVAGTAALLFAAAALCIATATALASQEEICTTHVARGN